MPTPHTIYCSDCNAELVVVDRRLDGDGDLFIGVNPCTDCLAVIREVVEGMKND